ncbi:MAG: patatin-like phospholipase family protein [Oscillospiraceae bacterium]
MKKGIVFEGGGMRGLYTGGVIDVLLENSVYADYVIGVSAGACNALNYLSGQLGRAASVNLDFLDDRRYLGLYCILRERSVFGMKFGFETVPNKLRPFDYDAFIYNPCQMETVITEAESGRAEYRPKEEIARGDFSIPRASSSLPIFSPPVNLGGRAYYDGGVADPIPVSRALDCGCDRLLIVLTQPRGYVKKPQSGRLIYKTVLRKYPKTAEAIMHRHEVYNAELDLITKLEARGTALVLAPSRATGVGRFERDRKKLKELYELGRADAEARLSQLRELFGLSVPEPLTTKES